MQTMTASKEKTAQNCTILNTKQLRAIAVLTAIPCEYSSFEEVAKKVGVCRRTLYNWFEDEVFNKRMKKEQEKNFVRYGSLVRSAHLKGIIEDRNPRLIQLYYERVEGWMPRQEIKDDTNKPIFQFAVPRSPFMTGEAKEWSRQQREKDREKQKRMDTNSAGQS